MSRSPSVARCRSSARSRRRPETHGPQGLGHAVLPPPSQPLSERHGVDVIVEEVRRRPGEIVLVTLGPLTNLALALEQGTGPAAAPEGLHAHGRRVRRLRQHDAHDRVEHPLRPGRREDRLRGPGARPSRPTRPSRAPRARAGRHGAGADPPRRRRPARATRGQHARRLDRAVARRGPDARDPLGRRATRSSATSPTPCASTWSSTRATTASTARSSTTRWPWPRRWIARSSRPSRSSSTSRRRASSRPGMTVADRRRLTGKPPNLDVAVEADIADVPRPAHRTRRGAGGGPVRRGTLSAEAEAR